MFLQAVDQRDGKLVVNHVLFGNDNKPVEKNDCNSSSFEISSTFVNVYKLLYHITFLTPVHKRISFTLLQPSHTAGYLVSNLMKFDGNQIKRFLAERLSFRLNK